MSVIDPCHLPTDPSPLSVSMDETAADAFLTTCSDRTSTAFRATIAVAGRTATVTFVNNPPGAGVIIGDWGDGTPPGAPSAMSVASIAHTYARDGVYPISIRAIPTFAMAQFKTPPATQVLGLEAVVNWPPAPGTPLAMPAFITAHPPV